MTLNDPYRRFRDELSHALDEFHPGWRSAKQDADLKPHPRTLRRWVTGKSNPKPARLVDLLTTAHFPEGVNQRLRDMYREICDDPVMVNQSQNPNDHLLGIYTLLSTVVVEMLRRGQVEHLEAILHRLERIADERLSNVLKRKIQAFVNLMLLEVKWQQAHIDQVSTLSDMVEEALAKIDPDPLLRAMDFHQRGVTACWQLGDFKKAQDMLKKAVNLYKQGNDYHSLAGATCDVGLAYWCEGQLSLAEQHINESLHHARTYNDHNLLGIASGNKALVFISKGDLGQETQDLLMRHREMATLVNAPGEIARSHGNMGILYLAQGRYRESIAELWIDIDYHQQSAFHEVSNSYAQLSICHHALGEKDKAREYASIAHETAVKNRYVTLYPVTLHAKAINEPDQERARAYLHEAIEEVGHNRLLIRAALALQLSHLSRGAEAVKHSLEVEQLLREGGADVWASAVRTGKVRYLPCM